MGKLKIEINNVQNIKDLLMASVELM